MSGQSFYKRLYLLIYKRLLRGGALMAVSSPSAMPVQLGNRPWFVDSRQARRDAREPKYRPRGCEVG